MSKDLMTEVQMMSRVALQPLLLAVKRTFAIIGQGYY